MAPTEGKILRTVKGYKGDVDAYSTVRVRTGLSPFKAPKIEYFNLKSAVKYSYSVDGNEYTGSQVESANLLIKEPILKYIHALDEVKIYYNPANPKQSFLNHTALWKITVVICIGTLITMLPYLRLL